MTTDLRSAIADILDGVGHLDDLLAGTDHLPAIIAARTLVSLDGIRSDLRKLADSVEGATRSAKERLSHNGP